MKDTVVYQEIQNKSQLIDFFIQGFKPPSAWKIGVEHERFPLDQQNFTAIPYASVNDEPSIQKIFNDLVKTGWQPEYEASNIISLKKGQWFITLEPGCQFELSSAPLASLHDLFSKMESVENEINGIAKKNGIYLLSAGFNPLSRLQEVPMVPKKRYHIMKAIMPTTGTLGLEMMFRTSTLQVCLDYQSETDLIAKFRVALALQPITTALFANSPFCENKPNGYLSYRSHIWTDTDNKRCGMLPFVFEDSMSIERYVDYALEIPMYLVYRQGNYTRIHGQTFGDFLNGHLKEFPNERPNLNDWIIHLTTLYPEVRLKQYLEMRGCDSGDWYRLIALPSLWAGLLYDSTALEAAWDLVKHWTSEDRQTLREMVPKQGLLAKCAGHSVHQIATEVLKIAEYGLKQRKVLNSFNRDESIFLDPIRIILEKRATPADELLDLYHSQWKGSVIPWFSRLNEAGAVTVNKATANVLQPISENND